MKTILCLVFAVSYVLMQQALCGPVMSEIEGCTKFALDLLQSTSGVVAGNYMNVAISPFSVWSMLALLKEGSGGKTNQQLQKALHLSESVKDVRAAFRKIDNVLHKHDTGVELENAGALFSDENRPLKWEFEYLAEKVYKANVFPVNYANPSEAVRYINQWVSNITHHQINQIVHEDDMKDPQLVIANGLFFEGRWETPFNASYTLREKFYDDNGEELGEVMMMKLKNHFRFTHIFDLGVRVVELPYQGGQYSMFIMVPHHNKTLDSVLEQLRKMSIEEIYNRMVKEDEDDPDAFVEVLLPRIVIHSDYVLNKALENMGIIDLFNDAKADLSGISSHSLYLHKIIHKTKIVINEEGTVASTATGGIAMNKDMMPVIQANRPFAFFIVENSMKLVMFAGKVVNPHM